MNKNEKNLVIVESPAKAKTIGKILGNNYQIESSIGHVRDLPVNKIGVNTRKNFEAEYEISKGKEKVVKKLLEAVKESDFVYLATDPDREGEAIAWHLEQVLNLSKKKSSRVKFNEITSTAIKEAFQNAGEINQDKVDAQQARRILDRLVGYKVSPLIRRKIGGRSAGRVQSVAVRLICEREAEINAFQQEEYWSFLGQIEKSSKNFNAQLISFEKKKIVSPDKEKDNNICIRNLETADKIKQKINPPKQLIVSSVQEKALSRKPNNPFITSTLQRAAASLYGFGVKKTMQIAQQLYEGIDIYKNNSPVGLITYMRTDSIRISEKAQEEAEEYIKNRFGAEYCGDVSEKSQKTNKKNVQDAHEAIRPTYIDKAPEELKNILNSDQYRLYKLIWERFLASQMAPANIKKITVEFEDLEKIALFRASSQKIIFAGFMELNRERDDDEEAQEEGMQKSLPTMQKGDEVLLKDLKTKQHFTEPPPRYNEASLVKTLEELGIGRPSTYATIISTILDREYVQKNENKNLEPTKLGIDVNKALCENFGNIFESKFTAEMESKLDEIEKANLNWKEMLKEFYEPFKGILKEAQDKMESLSVETDYECPTCKAKMLLKSGFYGPFLACSKYPDCKTTLNLTKDGKPIPEDRPSGKPCPKCSTEMNITYGRFGDYLLCPNEECKHKMPIIKSLGIPCPKEGCKGEIIEKKSRFGKMFYGCTEWSNTKCDAVFWNKPIDEKCPKCNSMLTYKNLKRGDKIVCPVKDCGYERLASPEDIAKYK